MLSISNITKERDMKGILLAGGSGTRLHPLTMITSKQILPVHDKPMIYYPLSSLMNIGIRDILIISTPRDLPVIRSLFRDGSQLGLNLSYKVQPSPDGIAQALILAEEFIDGDTISLILGDNIFYGSEISGNNIHQRFKDVLKLKKGAAVMAYQVHNPKRYGVVEFDKSDKAISIEEKPKEPKSNWAVTGWYFYDNDAIEIAKGLKPSARGEIEITDVNAHYLKRGDLSVIKMERGFAWLDAGTHESRYNSTQFVKVIEDRQGLKIACLEEIAYNRGFIDFKQFEKLALGFKKGNSYGDYLKRLLTTEK